MPTLELEHTSRYEDFQAAQNAEYRKAWDRATPGFKKKVKKLGVAPNAEIDPREGGTLEFAENTTDHAVAPDLAEAIDTYLDIVIERYGGQHAQAIRDIAIALQEPMKREIERNRAWMLGRVALYLARGEKCNVMARIHSFLHAVPLLAKEVGFPSLRSSARECKCSVEWIKKSRARVCYDLQIPVPAENTKKEGAKVKYSQNGRDNHWRRQKCSIKKPCNGHAVAA